MTKLSETKGWKKPVIEKQRSSEEENAQSGAGFLFRSDQLKYL